MTRIDEMNDQEMEDFLRAALIDPGVILERSEYLQWAISIFKMRLMRDVGAEVNVTYVGAARLGDGRIVSCRWSLSRPPSDEELSRVTAEGGLVDGAVTVKRSADN